MVQTTKNVLALETNYLQNFALVQLEAIIATIDMRHFMHVYILNDKILTYSITKLIISVKRYQILLRAATSVIPNFIMNGLIVELLDHEIAISNYKLL